MRLEAVVNCDTDCDDLDTVELLVHVMYEARFVLSKHWASSVWPRVHYAVVSICNRTGTPLCDKNLEIAKVCVRAFLPVRKVCACSRFDAALGIAAPCAGIVAN